MDDKFTQQPNEPPPQAAREKRPFRIKIGSERDADSAERVEQPAGDEPDASRPPSIGTGPDEGTFRESPQEPRVFPPPRLQSLSADLEEEINEVLSGVSMESILGRGDAGSGEAAELEVDGRYPATVVKVHRDDIFFSLPGGHQGVTSAKQLPQIPEPGQTIEVVIARLNQEDGLYEVRIPGTSIRVEDWSDLAEGVVLEARVTGHNSGGLECEVGGIRGFIPASHVGLFRVEDLAEFVDQKLPCVVMEVNQARGKLVLSHRSLLEREREESRQALLQSLEIGQVQEGVVRSIRDFGAFVDLGGVDGLVHISQLSWERVKHPSEVLQEGQRVKVKIEKVDQATGKVSLSYRDLLENPWDNIESKYPVNSLVRGRVSKIADFGAFVRLEAGVEGLIHISELAHRRVVRVENVVREGDEVETIVLSVDRASQRIALSLKAAQAAAATEDTSESPAEEEQRPAVQALRRSKTPLKGGVDRRSGGEDLGLRW